MKFTDIPQVTSQGNYRINLDWVYLIEWLERQMDQTRIESGMAPLNIDPEFQRAHVWTEDQQIKYVEHVLSGAATAAHSNILKFNCVGFKANYEGPFVLVDGKQRLNAVLRFLKNEIKAYGFLFNEFEDRLPHYCEFIVVINNLKTEKEVLQWYIEMNSGGTVHTDEEINKVKLMLEELKCQ